MGAEIHDGHAFYSLLIPYQIRFRLPKLVYRCVILTIRTMLFVFEGRSSNPDFPLFLVGLFLSFVVIVRCKGLSSTLVKSGTCFEYLFGRNNHFI